MSLHLRALEVGETCEIEVKPDHMPKVDAILRKRRAEVVDRQEIKTNRLLLRLRKMQ